MAQKEYLRPLDALGSLVEVLLPGYASWYELRGAQTVGHDAGVAPTSQVLGFRFRSTSRGQVPIEPVTYDFGVWVPTGFISRRCREARDDSKNVTVRHTYYGQDEFTPAETVMAQIAAGDVADAGDITKPFAGLTITGAESEDMMEWWLSSGSVYDLLMLDTAANLGDKLLASENAGKVLQIEGIEINDDNEVEAGIVGAGAKPGGLYAVNGAGVQITAAVAATRVNKIRSPGVRFQFAATITQYGSFNAGSEGDTPIKSGVQFQPLSAVPQAKLWLGDKP